MSATGQFIMVKTKMGQSLLLDDKFPPSVELKGGGRTLKLSEGMVQIS
jgi:hypothetical protein